MAVGFPLSEMKPSFSPPFLSTLLFLLLYLTWSALAHQLHRRALSCVNPSAARAASSICHDNQKAWIQHFQDETALLAKAGADALGWVFHAIYGSAPLAPLSVEDRTRLVQTYISLYGAWDKDDASFDAPRLTQMQGGWAP